MEVRAETFEAKRKHAERLLRLPYVVGVMVGKKWRGGVQTAEDAVIVLVSQKKPLELLLPYEVVPLTLGDVLTDVIEVGEIVAFQDPTAKWRPAPGGVSIGHYQVSAGTLGATVQDRTTGELLILSNNHVLANSNRAINGDSILQPGQADGGLPNDKIGDLLRFVPILFDGQTTCRFASCFVAIANHILAVAGRKTRLAVNLAPRFGNQNLVDCALARPGSDADIALEILQIGRPQPSIATPVVGMEVQKFGRTTKYTKDKILGLDATVSVAYGPLDKAIFEQQIVAGPMSAGGDSGSLVLDMENRPVGLLFAGSETVTIINEIGRVLDALRIEFPS